MSHYIDLLANWLLSGDRLDRESGRGIEREIAKEGEGEIERAIDRQRQKETERRDRQRQKERERQRERQREIKGTRERERDRKIKGTRKRDREREKEVPSEMHLPLPLTTQSVIIKERLVNFAWVCVFECVLKMEGGTVCPGEYKKKEKR